MKVKMLPVYETIIILNPNKTKERVDEEIDALAKILSMNFCSERSVKVENMGEKKLAYKIERKDTGYYATFRFAPDPEKTKIAEWEKLLKIKPDILKFITIKTDDEFESITAVNKNNSIDALDVLFGRATYAK